MTPIFQKVAVIGAGAMGRGIAQIAAQAGSQVWLYDTQTAAVTKALDAVYQQWDKLQEKGRLTAEAVAGHKSRLLGASSLLQLYFSKPLTKKLRLPPNSSDWASMSSMNL